MVLSPTEVEVSWLELDPIDRNGIIFTYEVDYQPVVVFEGSEAALRVNTTNTTIVLTELHQSVQYDFTVRAFTIIGPGPFSDLVVGVLEEARKSATIMNLI